jgi:tRNA threonylcarbamoyladenosine biosynthesis protein TsaE
MKIISKSEKQTYNLAKKFTRKLKGGEILCLVGDLGAGKTAFTKGLAAGLGVKNIITSPTFVLMKVYSFSSPLRKGRLGGVKGTELFVHIDAYRLSDGRQLEDIGAKDYFNQPDSVTVIEWADRVKDIWPKKIIEIKFKILEGNKREIIMK